MTSMERRITKVYIYTKIKHLNAEIRMGQKGDTEKLGRPGDRKGAVNRQLQLRGGSRGNQ